MSVTQAMLFPWFLLRLLLAISPTLFRFALIPTRQYWYLILAILFLVITLSLHLWTSGSPLSSTPLHTSPQTTTGTIDQEIQYWEKLRQLQPTHRDVLVNLSALYQLKGDTVTANKYLEQAKNLDPNHPLFQD